MNSAGPLDWVFLVSGWSLAAVGALLLLWALLKDRARGRSRCPRCWYELAGVPRREDGGGTCPECGRGWRREKELRRTRRRWRWAVVAVIVGVVGVGVAKVPEVRAAGWPRAVPMTVLSFVAPLESQPSIQMPSRAMYITPSIAPGALASTPPIGVQLDEETWQRIADNKSWDWQAEMVVRRWFAHNRFKAEEFFAVPLRWPEGELVPVYFRPAVSAWAGGAVSLSSDVPRTEPILLRDDRVKYTVRALKPGDEAVHAVVWFAVGGKSVRAATVSLACTAVARRDLLDRLESPELNTRVGQLVDPRLKRWKERIELFASDRDSGAAWSAVDFAIAYRVELLRDGKVIGRGLGMANWDYPVWKTWQGVEWVEGSKPTDADLEAIATDPSRASIRVTGDVERAVQDFMRWPFSKTRAAAWAGSFEVPVRVEVEETDEPGRSRKE